MLFAPGTDPAGLANFIGYSLAHNAERYGIQVTPACGCPTTTTRT
ncbi:hypothetical protein [Enhygromyxa salina]|nr:hypothetical protein [Enhygromyxa salina]